MKHADYIWLSRGGKRVTIWSDSDGIKLNLRKAWQAILQRVANGQGGIGY